jgi:hypothetical protein
MENYLFKTSTNQIHHFFLEDNTLKLRQLNPYSVWTKPILILDKTTKSFAMDMDCQDDFHMIYQDIEGNISYAFWDGGKTLSYEILKSRTNEIYEKNFQIILRGESLHFFYILQKENMKSLIHHALENSKLQLPNIIGTIENANILYTLCKSSLEKIHVFFAPNENGKSIFHKYYSPDKEEWEEAQTIKTDILNISCLSSSMDSKQQPFIIVQETYQDQTASLFMFSIKGNGTFEKYKPLPYSKSFKDISISDFQNEFILSTYNQSFFYIQKINRGKLLWEAPIKIPLDSYKMCKFRSNVPFERFFIPKTPISLVKGLYLPILDKVKLKENYKHEIQEELNTLKYKILTLEREIYRNK